jgi:thioredoxin 1
MKENHMSTDRPINITDDDFEKEVLQKKGIVVVDFWAPWCGPCHTMAPALEAFAAGNSGKMKVCKIDADDNPKTTEQYEIRSLPTVVFFKDGRVIETHVGALTQPALQAKLDALFE